MFAQSTRSTTAYIATVRPIYTLVNYYHTHRHMFVYGNLTDARLYKVKK